MNNRRPLDFTHTAGGAPAKLLLGERKRLRENRRNLESWLTHSSQRRCREGEGREENRRDWGPIYTRSQDQRSTQIQHSYWCKSWNQPQPRALHYQEYQDWNRKKLFNLPPSTNKCWTWGQIEKFSPVRIHPCGCPTGRIAVLLFHSKGPAAASRLAQTGCCHLK